MGHTHTQSGDGTHTPRDGTQRFGDTHTHWHGNTPLPRTDSVASSWYATTTDAGCCVNEGGEAPRVTAAGCVVTEPVQFLRTHVYTPACWGAMAGITNTGPLASGTGTPFSAQEYSGGGMPYAAGDTHRGWGVGPVQ